MEGSKWVIENFVDAKEPIVLEESDVSPKTVINIFNCQRSTIQIKGKVNAIFLGK